MDLALHLVSSVNIYNVAFVSMAQTLKDIEEQQVSMYQQKILADSLAISIRHNTKRLLQRIQKIRLTVKVYPNVVGRDKVNLLLEMVRPYEVNVLTLERILSGEISQQTHRQCLPLLEEMNQQMRAIIQTMQADLKITTKLSV